MAKLNSISIEWQDRSKYLNASNIGSIVAFYKGYKFKDYGENVFYQYSYKKWTPEQQAIISARKSEAISFIAGRGERYEHKIIQNLQDWFGGKGAEVIDFYQQPFANENYKISATPDVLLIKDDKKMLFEIKLGKSDIDGETNNKIELYKYQVACQLMLLPDFDINNPNHSACIYFGIDETNHNLKYLEDNSIGGYVPYIVKKDEILKMQQEILECSRKFWQDFEILPLQYRCAEEWEN